MKFGTKHYWASTPKKIKKIADAVLGAVTFAGGILALNGKPELATGVFVTGIIAKFVSNLFGEDTPAPETKP